MILLVDDDLTFLERAREILNRDRRVFWASNSKQALRLAEDLGFSVALVNVDLRVDDGLKLIGEMHEKFPRLPIIAIDGAPGSEFLKLAKELWAVEILHKPVTPEWKPVVERVRATAARR